MQAKSIAMMAMAGMMLWGGTDVGAQKKSGGWGNSSWSGCSGAMLGSSPTTNKVGSTTYVSGQCYQTGCLKVELSSAVRSEFLIQRE